MKEEVFAVMLVQETAEFAEYLSSPDFLGVRKRLLSSTQLLPFFPSYPCLWHECI